MLAAAPPPYIEETLMTIESRAGKETLTSGKSGCPLRKNFTFYQANQ